MRRVARVAVQEEDRALRVGRPQVERVHAQPGLGLEEDVGSVDAELLRAQVDARTRVEDELLDPGAHEHETDETGRREDRERAQDARPYSPAGV